MDCVQKFRMSPFLFSIVPLIFHLVFLQVACAFPTVYPTGTTIYDPSQCFNGYTIYKIAEPNAIVLVDMDGDIVNYWENEDLELRYSEPLPNGNLLSIANTIDTEPRRKGLVELDWYGNVVWEIFFVQKRLEIHHDFERLENGNTLILSRRYRYMPKISLKPILDDQIIEVDPEGNIIWEWHTSDHFDEFQFSREAKRLIAKRGGDWAHTNSMQSLPENPIDEFPFLKGNILVSQRATNIIFIIDKGTGMVVWKIGPDDNLTIGQHDAKMIPARFSGEGNILVFDNGGVAGYPKKFRPYSRVLEIDPLSKRIVNGYDAKVSGRMRRTFFSAFHSGAQRLPNGNTLIDEAEYGRFFEITPEGEIVWEYINPFSWIDQGVETRDVYRAWRVPFDWSN